MAEPLETVLSEDLNILIISSNQEVLTVLQASINSKWKTQRKDRPYRCRVHICPNSPYSLEQTKKHIHFDFVIFIIESNLVNCLQEIEKSLKYIGDSFNRQRICLVAVGVNHSTAIKPEELWTFARVYQFNLLIGSVECPVKAEHLSERILNLSEVSCGVFGAPFVGKI